MDGFVFGLSVMFGAGIGLRKVRRRAEGWAFVEKGTESERAKASLAGKAHVGSPGRGPFEVRQ